MVYSCFFTFVGDCSFHSLQPLVRTLRVSWLLLLNCFSYLKVGVTVGIKYGWRKKWRVGLGGRDVAVQSGNVTSTGWILTVGELQWKEKANGCFPKSLWTASLPTDASRPEYFWNLPVFFLCCRRGQCYFTMCVPINSEDGSFKSANEIPIANKNLDKLTSWHGLVEASCIVAIPKNLLPSIFHYLSPDNCTAIFALNYIIWIKDSISMVYKFTQCTFYIPNLLSKPLSFR